MKLYWINTATDGGSEECACYRGSTRGRASQWLPAVFALIVAMDVAGAQTRIDLRTQAKSVDFSGASSTKPSKTGTVLPATCSVGETFLKTDAPAGQNFYACTTGNLWSLQGAVIPGVTGFANMVLATDGSALIWKALGGDVSGPPASLTVSKLQGRPISAMAPANGQSLVWNSTVSQWQPQNLSGGVSGVFGRTGAVIAQTGDYSFGQISGTVADTQLGAGINANKIAAGLVNNSTFGYLANVTSDLQTQLNSKTGTAFGLTGDLSGTLARATVGAIQSRSVSTISPTGGQVLTWNLGTNQWEPQSLPGNSAGSYSKSFTAQISVTIPGALHQLGTSNLLVGCFDTATPNMRVQPNTVSVSSSSYDVTVTFATPQSGRCVVSAGGGGGSAAGGASMASQLGDFGVTWTSGSMLTLGPNCSAATPCNVRIGNSVHRYVTGAAITVTGGTGAAYIYVDANGVLTVGHNLTLSCPAPCTAVSPITAFPVNSIPLYTWTATGGNWDAAGGVDQRAVLGAKALSAGTGIMTLDTGSGTNISVDAATVPAYLTAAASLGFGSIANGSCAVDKTFPLPGAAVGDAVAPGWPGAIETGLIGAMWVSAPNLIAVRLCNLSGAALTPAITTYRGTIVRSF